MNIRQTMARRHLLKSLALCSTVAASMLCACIASANTYTVTNTNDAGTGSLRQALLNANANPGADTIKFASGVKGTIVLQSALPVISDDLTIVGPGSATLTIRAYIDGGLFVISSTAGTPPTVAISGITVQNGMASAPHVGGVGDYAGLDNYSGKVTLQDCNFLNAFRRGIYNSGGSISVSASQFNGSSSPAFSTADGGAIYNAGGTCSFDNCLFDHTWAMMRGGCLFNAGGVVTFNSCTLQYLGICPLGVSLVSGKSGGLRHLKGGFFGLGTPMPLHTSR